MFRDTLTPDGEGLKGISWIGLRYLLTEIVYGSYVKNASDQTNMSSVVDYWVGPNAVKKEFEGTKCKFFCFFVIFGRGGWIGRKEGSS